MKCIPSKSVNGIRCRFLHKNFFLETKINKDTIKDESTTTSFSLKQHTVHTEEHGTELQTDESSSTHSTSYILSTENTISQSYHNVKSSEDNNELIETMSNPYTSFNSQNYTTYKLSESSHKKMPSEYKKFKSNLNQFSYTSTLPMDKQLVQNNSKQREEKFENNQNDLWNSDIHELCDHMMKPMNIITSLDNSTTVNIKTSNDMGEKSSTDRIFYPYHHLDQQQQQQQQHQEQQQQQQLQLTNVSNQTTQKKYSLIKFQEEEDSNNIKVANHNELKETNEKINEILVVTSLAYNNNNESLNYPIIDQSFNVNSSLHEIQCFNEYQVDNKENKDIYINKQDETLLYSLTNDRSSLKLIENSFNDISSITVSIALTENNNNNISNNFDKSHEIESYKSSINNYFLSLSCPQSLSNQLTEENYNDTISECSDFSLHVPITNSIINENSNLNELKLSSLHNFQEYYANRQLWEPFHSYWYIHILKRITEETLLTGLPEQSINKEKYHTEYMSSSSSSRGSYFTSQRRRPHSSAYSYELNSFIDDNQGVYESPNSSSSIIHSNQSYNHKSLHDIYPDRYMKSLDYDDTYRTNFKISTRNNLRPTYDNRPYRSYSEASSILHQPKDKLNLASIIRYDHRKNKLGLMHHSTSNRMKHITSSDVENVLQQRNLKDSSQSIKPLSSRDNDKQKDFPYTSRFNKNYQDYEIGNRLRRGSLRSYTPTNRSFYTPQTKWLNDENNNYLEVGSYFSLPLNDYHRKRVKHTRPTSTSQRCVPSSIELSPHRKIQSDKWDKSGNYLSRKIGNLSKSTGHLTHLDDLNRISGCTSMQTLRARLAAAHSEFNLDNRENITDSFQSHGFNGTDRSGSLDRRTDLANDFTTRQLRRQVEQHHRRLLKSLMTDEPFESSWPSSFSNFDLQGYLNSYPNDSEMQPTTLISSTLAPPIFSTASTRLPLNIEQSRTDDTIMDPTNNYISTINQQMLSIPNILTTPNLNSTTPVVLPNQFPLTNTLIDKLINTPVIHQPTSLNVDEPVSISNNTLMELINNPDTINSQGINNVLQNTIESEQANNYQPTENFSLNNTNNDVINNVSNINSTYLNTMNIPYNDNNLSRMNTSSLSNENNSCVNPITSDSIDVLIEQVRRLLNEQNNYNLNYSKTTPINTTVDGIISSSNSVNVTPFNNQLQSSSSMSRTCQSVVTKGDRLQNPEHIYTSNYQKSIKQTLQQEPIDSINQYHKTPSETIDSWLGLSEDEWNYKNYKETPLNLHSRYLHIHNLILDLLSMNFCFSCSSWNFIIIIIIDYDYYFLLQYFTFLLSIN
ncbi:Protein piccolo [Schistosoma japonicum]|nr:Protein piccolo [Schistosoma japonicum]